MIRQIKNMKLQNMVLLVLFALFVTACAPNPFNTNQADISKTLDRAITALEDADCQKFLNEVSPVLISKISTDATCQYIFEDQDNLKRTTLVLKFVKGSKGKLNDAENEYIVDLKPLGLEDGEQEFKMVKIQNRWLITQ